MAYHFAGNNANNIWKNAYNHIYEEMHLQEGRDQETYEITHVIIELLDPRKRFVYSRKINLAFAFIEVIWIMNGSKDLSFLEWWNPRMKNYSDDGYHLNGAYGFRLRNNGFDQLRCAYETLRQDPNSRQVVLQIWDMEKDFPYGAIPVSKDVPCNIVSHLMIRNNKLEWLQVMRSNDLIWGLPYNLIQWTMLQEIMAGWLGIDVGSYIHISDSLHIYKRHWKDAGIIESELKEDAYSNINSYNILTFEESEKLFKKLWNMVDVIRQIANPAQAVAFLKSKSFKELPEAYKNMMTIILSESLHRKLDVEEALFVIEEQCANNLYAFIHKNWMGV